jgi:hypothetical protein
MDLDQFITKFGGMSEEYSFYGGEVKLRYYDNEHAYYFITPEGKEEKQDGVTTVCHIIDKSDALVPWGCKMMAQKLMLTIPGTKTAGAVIMTEVELEDWVTKGKSAHKEKLEEAGKTGHIAHNWIEQYIKLIIAGEIHLAAAMRVILPFDERAAHACGAAFTWMDRHNVRWLGTERKIYHRQYKYAGTMDGLCLCDSCDDQKCCPVPFKDRMTIADWKTSNYLYLEYLLQTAAYQAAYNDEQDYLSRMNNTWPCPVAVDRWVIRLGKDDGEFEAWHLQAHNFEEDFGGFLATLDLTRRVRALKQRLQDRKDDLRAAIKAEKLAQKEAKALVEAAEKASAKAEKAQQRLEALAEECKSARNYKGKRYPSCKTNAGGPCKTCLDIWEVKHLLPVTTSFKEISALEAILNRS